MRTIERIKEVVQQVSETAAPYLEEDNPFDADLVSALSELRQSVGEPVLVFNNGDQQRERLIKTRRRIEDRLRKDPDTVWRIAALLGVDPHQA